MTKMELVNEVNAISRAEANENILPLLLEVLNDLHRQGLSYCYWKSSRRVHQVLAGEGDLDLLVSRQDQHRIAALLLQRGLKLFPSVSGRDHPAVASFLGFDEPSGKLVHVHLHFRLVSGERLLKNYRIPWEDALLSHAVRHPTLPIMILEPVSEALLLTIRACLELSRMDLVTLRHWDATKQKFALDREALLTQIERKTLCERSGELFGNAQDGEDLAGAVVSAFFDGGALHDAPSLRRRVREHFAAQRSYNAFEFRLRSLGRTLLWLAGGLNKSLLHWPRPWSRRAPGGGCVVALIGVDGSGKSTAVSTMRKWLGTEIDTMPIYFGTGDGRPSLLLWPLKLVMPLLQRSFKTKPKGSSHGKVSSRPPGLLYSALLTGWAMVVAREKRIKLVSARRAANRGLVVLADRYPQDEILGFNDGPLLTRLSKVPGFLRRHEARAYALSRSLPPDLVLKLMVSPPTAKKREPNMDLDVIRDRVGSMEHLAFPGARVVRVDAEQPLVDVIAKIKREIWRQL
ncbi:MAG: hypothetical protein JO105_04275 [Hyphomicrobiales bacterium]|nr:hypothetical protein [Hyphomicrobiales bacterium]